MSPTIEQRTAPRKITMPDKTYVELMEWKGTPITRGKLLNVSTGGALILVEKVGAPDRPLWIRLERAPETGWIAADVARVDRPQEVAIRFRPTCPLDFFLAATLRPDSNRTGDNQKLTPGQRRSQHGPLAGRRRTTNMESAEFGSASRTIP